MIYNVAQGTEGWHSIRLGRMTASKFSDVMAGESTATYKNLIMKLAVERIKGTPEDGERYENEWMERGTLLEPEARMYYEALKDCEVYEVGFMTPEIGPLSEWIGVSPDGLIGEDGMLEIKCPKDTTQLEYLKRGVLPSTYRWQVQGQLWVSERAYCDFLSYHPQMKQMLLRVEPDAEMHKQLEVRILQAIKDIELYINDYEKY